MIVQSAPAGKPHFVILQTDHARMSGQFAAAFGNEQFAALAPRQAMEFVSGHHDEGWAELDSRVLQDPETGLPYNLVKTPLPELVRTGSGSPDYNEAYHPYSGLMSSMHTYGLYHGRYGLSDKIFIDLMPADIKPFVTEMLATELGRQVKLKKKMEADPDLADQLSEKRIFDNYKLLQFFDTLALYFHMTAPELRGESNFPHVPQQPGQDVTITIKPVSDGTYALDPFPFKESGLTFSVIGRYLSPQSTDTDLVALFNKTETATQTITLVEAA